MLFSVSSVFGLMTGANEVVAVKSLGISPMVVVWPALVLAGFLSLGTVCMYEIAATWCRPSRERVFCESLVDTAYSMLQRNRSYTGDQFSVNVKRVAPPAKPGDNPKLIEPTITIFGPPRVTLTAAEAELRIDWPARKIWIIYTDSEVDFEGLRYRSPKTEKYALTAPEPAPRKEHRDYVAMRDIPDLLAGLEAKRRLLEELREAKKALGEPESTQEAKDIQDIHEKIFDLRTEPYRRWANGFSCLFFALIGTPVAMLRRHADVLTNFFSCFLPILVVYYPLLTLSNTLTTSGLLWPICFWMANAVLVIPAVLLLRQIVRH
jgi:lipopolysaccharide export system permease protein